MKHLLALISMSLCFSSCNEKRKLPVIEMLNISNAYVNDEGYPAIEFQIKNIQETPICLPISIFNGNHTYYANLEIKTKYGRQLKEKRINGRPGIDDAWKFLRIEPNAQDSSFIVIKRKTLKNTINGKSDLTVRLKFWGGFCTESLEPKADADFIAISNPIKIEEHGKL